MIDVVVDRIGGMTGTAGVAHRLVTTWLAEGRAVTVWGARGSLPSGAVIGRFGWWGGPRRALGGARSERALGLDRTPGPGVWRASGGHHARWVEARGRGWTWRDRRVAAREAACVATARTVVANSEAAADALVRAYGVGVRVVRNGVDLDRYAPTAVRPGPLRVGFMAHGWERKGFDVAVDAFVDAGPAGAEFWVAGQDVRASRRLAAARQRLGDRLVVHGVVDAASWLPAIDVLLHPTRYDSAANVVLEALACGVPVVTTAADGASEVVPDSRWVAAAADRAAVASALDAVVSQGERARRVARSAAEVWPLARMARELFELLEVP